MTGGPAAWFLMEAYDLPAAVAAVGTTPAIPGSKYCVTKFDYGATNGLPFGSVNPHLCSSGNVYPGLSATSGLASSLALDKWYSTASLAIHPKADDIVTLPATVPVTPAIPLTEYFAWRIPCYPALSGYCSVKEGTTPTAPDGATTDSQLV